ncbi:class I SAM-dependent methyltransferase [Bacillus sp. DTU_2020_1000418_1_SI_GHA_SEK_038]|uniref:class I SAM-dependent methyltransferase n=1 Tax=Bacillus sp. DTU_2020_1000418_1_SI_GHA_SEK_038 TaxID=3077585 RepID=UPI0028E3D3C9|nr:class I SAM-dependent methyltransferase [Bacillus sp. DTU_2020_1000418_1_SI_GHA_SEK_038]WNS73941.1 class I SAM-dependent methyltransferase [Bacillus sp. DTU_2020_1000418_1_SI_GHA_SEK_038]
MEKFEWSKEAEKQWDEKSASWNSMSKEMWESGSRKDIAPFFSENVPSGSTVCDLGCGDGFGSLKLAEAGYIVTGIDVSEEMIEKAKEINQNNRSQFIKGDISSVPFDEDSFDAVMAINSFEWTEDPLKALIEAQRIVKPGGYACIGILGPTAAPRVNSYRRLYQEKVICNTMMPWEFEKLAEENNWHKVGELGVYKRGAAQLPIGSLSLELRHSLSFMWVFMLKNGKQDKEDDH